MRQRVIAKVLFLAVALVLGVAAVSACSSDDDEGGEGEEPSPTTVAESTTTAVDPSAQEEAAVREARQAADEARIASAAPPEANPDDPSIEATHTGPMLEQWKQTMTGLRTNGWAIRYPENSQHLVEVESVRLSEDDGQEVAFLEVCSVEDSDRIVVATGEVLAGGLSTIKATEAMRKVDGVWKLAERREDDYQEGVAECAGE